MGRKNKSKIINTGRIRRRRFLTDVGILSGMASFGVSPLHSNPSRIHKRDSSSTIRLGIIGFGFRGEQLARAMRFAHPEWISEQRQAEKEDHRHHALEDFYNLDDLGIALRGVSDVYDVRLQRGLEASAGRAKGYTAYQKLLRDKDIDAVIIATPDHWHAEMAIQAAKAGKHVYLEKCMTRTVEEAKILREVINEEGVVFQVGHQGRQRDAHHRARQLIGQGTLGDISMVEMTTNRNNSFGAWLWPIDEEGTPERIDWAAFQGPAPNKVPFDAERYFRWRCWYDYGTGMSGDLLTHEYDAVNSILDLGIPDSAVASGGIYHYNDGRDVPDVFQASFEYNDRKLSLLYSGTLSNGTPRGTLIMGTDATLELGKSLTVWADSESVKYRNRIESGIIDPDKPIVNYDTDNLEIDALTSATSKYFADRGLMYTYQGGRRYDTTHLHIREWLQCIRNGGMPSCHIEKGFEEAVTAHMATISYLKDKKVYWDRDDENIVVN